MMPREKYGRQTLLVLLMLTLTASQRVYDTNDWIPITQPKEHNIQKKQARVLTLTEPSGYNFFPEEYRGTRQAEYQQQYLRETTPISEGRPVKQALTQQPQQQLPQKRPFTPQQLEQYYINQRQQLAQLQESKRPLQIPQQIQQQQLQQQQIQQPQLQQQQLQHLQIPQQQITQQQQPSVYNNLYYQQNLLNQPYNLPDYLIPPESLQPQFVSPQYVSQNQKQNSPLQKTGPVQFHDEQIREVINRPPTANGTVDFYKVLNLGYQNNPQADYRPQTTPHSTTNKDNIQLVYVPLEQLQQQNNVQFTNNDKFKNNVKTQKPPLVSLPVQANIYASNQNNLLKNIQNDFIQQAVHAHKLQQQFEQGNYQPSTQSPPIRQKKRKPHQPPLAVYMNGNNNAKVTDVLSALKMAKSIQVQDTIGPESPKVFVGPANLHTPNGFTKFELPYLSNLESNRVERKVDQLPFFVAPLNYRTPPGYVKVPFPAPHVGTVVLNMNDIENVESGETQSDNGEDYLLRYHPTTSTLETAQVPAKLTTTGTTTATSTTSHRTQRTRGRPHQSPELQNLHQNQHHQGAQQHGEAQHHQEVAHHQQVPRLQDSQRHQEVPNRQEVQHHQEVTHSQKVQHNEEVPYRHEAQPSYKVDTSSKKLNHHREQTHHHRNQQAQPAKNFDIVQSVSTTYSPYDEQNFGRVYEELVTTQQFPDIKDVFSIIPQIDREKIAHAGDEEEKQKDRQYLPKDGQVHSNAHVNYDHLFQLPFATNSEVNQINGATKGKENIKVYEDDGGRYVVLEEFPIKSTVTNLNKFPTTTSRNVADDVTRRLTTPKYAKISTETVSDDNNNNSPYIIPGLINELVDPPVKQLLTPILLAPTEKAVESTTTDAGSRDYSPTGYHEPSSTRPPKVQHLTVTQAVVTYADEDGDKKNEVTTTKKPFRTRGRGNSRYVDRTTSTTSRSSARRAQSRTRTPHPSRVRTSTTPSEYIEYTTTPAPRRVVSQRQRFRTRGRPQITEGYSTTSSNVLATNILTTSTVPSVEHRKTDDDAYRQDNVYVEESVRKPQLITSSKSLSPEEEYLINKYNLAYTITQDPKTNKVNVKILGEKDNDESATTTGSYTTRSNDENYDKGTGRSPASERYVVSEQNVANERNNHYASDRNLVSERSSERNLANERKTVSERNPENPVSERNPVRIRTRIRGRSTTTTTTAKPTTPTPTEAPITTEEEFYGFFRSPTYKSTEENVIVSSPSPYADDAVRIYANNKEEESQQVQYVGEIRPKYSTTTEKFYAVPITERLSMVLTTAASPATTPEPAKQKRTRGRVRVEDNKASVTRSPPQRTRSRGRTHFRLPEELTTEESQVNENYPELYLKAKESKEDYSPVSSSRSPEARTEKFRITVEPEFDDQETRSSQIHSKIALPERNHFQVERSEKGVDKDSVESEESSVGTEASSAESVTEVEDRSEQINVDFVPTTMSQDERRQRKGYWKLVKLKKATDVLEAAESQNVGVVKHNIVIPSDDFNKYDFSSETILLPSTTDMPPPPDRANLSQNFFDSILQIFSNKTTTNVDYSIKGLSSSLDDEEQKKRSSISAFKANEEGLTTTPGDVVLFNSQRDVRFETSTSTSTEISHETEICSKGVCVKSQDKEELEKEENKQKINKEDAM